MEAVRINTHFPDYKYFIALAIVFLDIGILFGALNSFRIGGYLNIEEIHQTHWTSTLFGGVSLLIMAQIYAILSNINGKESKYHKVTLVVLSLWVVGTLSNYMIVWASSPDLYLIISEITFKTAAILFTILVLMFLAEKDYISKLNANKTGYLLIIAVVWFAFAIYFFDIKNSRLDRVFLTSYVYGFFSFSLFGILGYIFPRWYSTKLRSTFQIRMDIIMLNIAGVILVTYDKYRRTIPFYYGYLGPLIWGITGLAFTLWLFDQVFRAGIRTSLVGSLVAFMMLGFFVFDTFMKNAFPNWVNQSHVHFLFLGSLLVTITSLGSQFMSGSDELLDRFDMVAVGSVIFFVSMILLSFTIINWWLAGLMGILLFVDLLIIQTLYIIRARKKI